jgi:hypothetical protein
VRRWCDGFCAEVTAVARVGRSLCGPDGRLAIRARGCGEVRGSVVFRRTRSALCVRLFGVLFLGGSCCLCSSTAVAAFATRRYQRRVTESLPVVLTVVLTVVRPVAFPSGALAGGAP